MSETECMKKAERAYKKLFGEIQDNEPNWRIIACEFRHARDTMGSFYESLCETIVIADLANTAKLRAAYPDLVRWLQDVDL